MMKNPHFGTHLPPRGTIDAYHEIHYMGWSPQVTKEKVAFSAHIPHAHWVDAHHMTVDTPPHLIELYDELSSQFEPVAIKLGDVSKTYTPKIIHINMRRRDDWLQITYNVAWYENEDIIVHGELYGVDITDEWASTHLDYLNSLVTDLPKHLDISSIMK